MHHKLSRRNFLLNTALASASLSPAFNVLSACALGSKGKKKLGVALVGLGYYSKDQLAPALQQTKNCYLAGLVTGSPEKANTWGKRYNIPAKNIYNYENFDSIADNPAIDIVYVVLPVFLHKEFTIRSAKAGKHVICEKPMAMSVQECDEMIAACREANKMLSIGYRLHFEPYNQEMMRLGQQSVYGKLQQIECGNGFRYGGDANNWRVVKSKAGGGALMDMGVYTIQGARYTTGEEPIFVTAREEKTRPEVFKDVDETIHYKLEFPSGCIAKGLSTYNDDINYLRAIASKGSFELSAAYRYGGMVGRTPAGSMQFPNINQQAAQMDDFAQCIVQQKATRVPGEMGRNDLKVIEAIYRSIASGKKEAV